jgi:hypothetical protein
VPIFPGQIPEPMLEKMEPADRRRLGKAGLTMAERVAKEEIRAERQLHNQFSGFLNRHGFFSVHADPTRKSTIRAGWPDYSVFKAGRVLFIEFKVGLNTLSTEQQSVVDGLKAGGFPVLITGDYQEAINAVFSL